MTVELQNVCPVVDCLWLLVPCWGALGGPPHTPRLVTAWVDDGPGGGGMNGRLEPPSCTLGRHLLGFYPGSF